MSELSLKIRKRFFNDKFFPFLHTQCRLQIFYGGASSGKSVFASQRRVIAMVREPRNYLVVRKVSNTIRSSVFTETIKAINDLHLSNYFDINYSLLEITYNIDGRKIFFRGLDDVEKLKSIVPSVGVLTDIEIEEATEITEEDFDKLKLRMRGLAPCVKRMCMYFNPIFRTHWIAKRFFEGKWIKYKYDGKILIVHSTYKDNKFLTEDDKENIEETKGYVHDVYALGKWGVLGDLIFTNWSITSCKEIDFDITRYGLDFGFTNDPSVVLKLGIDKQRKIIYIQQELYLYGATNNVLASRAKPMIGDGIVYCDNAEPKSIAELNDQGENSLSALPVKKGKDSVWHALQWLEQWTILIDKLCTHTIDEVSQYQWKKDKNGNTLNEPVEENDHCIAALRYGTEYDRLGFGAAISV